MIMKTEEAVKRALQKAKDTLYFKAEDYFSDKDFVLIFLHPRTLPSKEQLTGGLLDFFGDLEIRRSNLFKEAHRRLEHQIKKVCESRCHKR